jgi:hypothetical protein
MCGVPRPEEFAPPVPAPASAPAPAPAPAPVPPAPAAAHTAPRPKTKKERRNEKTAAAAAAEAADDALLEAAIAEARLAASAEPSPSSDDADDAGEDGEATVAAATALIEEQFAGLLEQLAIPTKHRRPHTAIEHAIIATLKAEVARVAADDHLRRVITEASHRAGLPAPEPQPQPPGAAGPPPSPTHRAPASIPAGSLSSDARLRDQLVENRPRLLKKFTRILRDFLLQGWGDEGLRDLLRRGGDNEDTDSK